MWLRKTSPSTHPSAVTYSMVLWFRTVILRLLPAADVFFLEFFVAPCFCDSVFISSCLLGWVFIDWCCITSFSILTSTQICQCSEKKLRDH